MVAHHTRVQDESYRAYVDMMVSRARPQKVTTPLLVLGGTDDQLTVPAEVEATAQAYGTEAELFPDMGHGMMLDVGWQQVADRMLEWLDGRVS